MNWSQRFFGAALVTGASSGIGTALARGLAARGLDLVLVARRADRLTALASELSDEFDVRCATVPADLTDEVALRGLPKRVAATGLEVGLLINNAGTGYYGSVADGDADDAARMVDLNCKAPVFLTHQFLPAMQKRNKGAVLFVGSTASFVSTPYCATYGASKAFNLAFAEALWAELLPTGIDVLALCPGYTSTEFQTVAGSANMPRLGGVHRPEDVAEAALHYLGQGPSLVPGLMDRLLLAFSRCMPRKTAARLARKFNAPPALRGGSPKNP